MSPLSMALSWKQLKETEFDRNPYRECDRFGWWEGRIDSLAHSCGSRTMLAGQGKRTGIHLFVQTPDGEKFWLFVIYRSDSLSHHRAKELNPGDRIRVEITQAKSGNPFVSSLEKLD